MKRRVPALLLSIVGLAFGGSERIVMGQRWLDAPTGWRVLRQSSDRAVLQSANGNEQATLSLVTFKKVVTFEEFKRLCSLRLEAERKELGDGFLDANEPTETQRGLVFFYSGADKRDGRIFSGYLSIERGELLTLYLEGIAVPPQEHLATFKALVGGVHRS